LAGVCGRALADVVIDMGRHIVELSLGEHL
jgi:hypothetical protein